MFIHSAPIQYNPGIIKLDTIQLIGEATVEEMPKNDFISRIKKPAFVSLGMACLVLGIIGFFIPGLPGTIWLIISASLFVRSSDRLYKFVINNRFFGAQIKHFLETGEMPLRAKIMSLSFMWIFSLASVLFLPYSWLFKIPVTIMAIIGTIYILSRRTSTS